MCPSRLQDVLPPTRLHVQEKAACDIALGIWAVSLLGGHREGPKCKGTPATVCLIIPSKS